MTVTNAALYCRISLDRSGEGLGVSRQEDACREKARALGWSVGHVYVDNDVSASSTKPRPQYQAMLAAMEAGTHDALVVWDLDRLTRRPIEVEHLIDLADRRGIDLATVTGKVDLASSSGRLFARIMGSVARQEVEHKAERQRAKNDQKAAAGEPFMGRRCFGYRDGGRALVQAEAAEYRAAVARLLDGWSVRAITKDWNERGVLTTAGNPWVPTQVRRLLANPRHAGLRVHRGQVVGQGSWPTVVSTDEHEAVTAILSDPARKPKGRPRAYLLSGVARCGVCSGRLYGRQERRGALYVCESAAHVARKVEAIDEYVSALVTERLSRPDASGLFAGPERAAEAADLRREVRVLQERLDGLTAAYSDGLIDLRALTTGSAQLRERIEATQARMPSTVPVPAALTGDVDGVWETLSVEVQRQVIGVVCEVTVHPAGRGARTFDPETVVVAPKG